jgi:NADH dehydrogenase FAD-containing subunit
MYALVPAGLVVWSTGIKAPPLVQRIQGVIKDKRGFLQTNQQLQILRESASAEQEPEAVSNVYAMGDCAHIKDHFLPATAQVSSLLFGSSCTG